MILFNLSNLVYILDFFIFQILVAIKNKIKILKHF